MRETPSYRADGLGPPCAQCGQRITQTSRALLTIPLGARLNDAIEIEHGPWRNEPCGCEVESDPSR